ncbi:MAG TPA: hypothetical protein VL859_02870 [Flavobacterium sp.]|nr:hypothetical protein [Flavobacterium sp.]
MNYYIKIILILIFYCIINPVFTSLYLSISGLPGGNVGMIPYGILLANIIATLISLLILYLIRLKKTIGINLSIATNNLIYIITLIYFGLNPFFDEMGKEYAKLDLVILLSSFLSSIIAIVVFKIVHARCSN